VSSLSLQPILALVGHPLSRNPTQYMLQEAFTHHNLDWRYLSVEVAPDDLGDAVRGMRAMGFCGGNCADPHKQAVIEHLDRTSEAAGRIGTVNLLLGEDGQLVGENTEGKAVVESLRRQIDPADKRILLLGTGRVARAVGLELAAAGVAELIVLGRTESKAYELIEMLGSDESKMPLSEMPLSAVGWKGDYHFGPETDVLINATSAGDLDPDTPLPLDLGELSPPAIVVDVTLNQPATWLLGEAAERGCSTVNGVEVFIEEAAINFRLWTGVDPDRAIMREAVEEFLEL